MAKYIVHPQELARSRVEMTKLTTDVEQLRREKADLQGELEAHKFTVRSGHVTSTQSNFSDQVM